MKIRTSVYICFLIYFVNSISSAYGESINSCSDIIKAIESPPNSPYAAIENYYEPSYVYLKSNECDPKIKERLLFEYGALIIKYIKNEKDLSEAAQRNYARKAATILNKHLSFWTTLTKEQQVNFIEASKGATLDPINLRDIGIITRWTWKRIGNSLSMLVQAYVIAKDQDSLLDILPDYAQYPEIFINEVVDDWYKWLKAQEQYVREKRPDEIRSTIENCLPCNRRWTEFDKFLTDWKKIDPGTSAFIKNRMKEWI